MSAIIPPPPPWPAYAGEPPAQEPAPSIWKRVGSCFKRAPQPAPEAPCGPGFYTRFQREIAYAADEMRMKRVRRHLEEAQTRLEGVPLNYPELIPCEPDFMVLSEDIVLPVEQWEAIFSGGDFSHQLVAFLESVKERQEEGSTKQLLVEKLIDRINRVLKRDEPPTAVSLLNKVQKYLHKMEERWEWTGVLSDLSILIRVKALELLRKSSQLEEIQRYRVSVEDLSVVPRSLSREAVFSRLRMAMVTSSDPLELEAYEGAREWLKSQPEWISEELLEAEAPACLIAVARATDSRLSLHDLVTTLGVKGELYGKLLTYLRGVNGEQHALFGYRQGIEGRHEPLVHKVLQTIGLDYFVLKKNWMELPSNSDGKVEGVMSKWIDARSFSHEWSEYRASRQGLIHAVNLGAKASIGLNRIETEVMGDRLAHLSDSVSPQAHALIGMLIGAFDSNIHQYILGEDGYNAVESARALLPKPLIESEGRHWAALSLVFLDHPDADLPLSSQLRQLVLSWDLDAIREKLAPLAVDFNVSRTMRTLGATIDRKLEVITKMSQALNTAEGEIGKQGGDPSQNEVVQNMRQMEERITDELMSNFRRMQEISLTHLHSEAFAVLLYRLDRVQQKVKKYPNITPRELAGKVYPELKLLIEVADRIEGEGGKRLRAQSIESLIHFLETDKEASAIATPNEIKKLKQLLENAEPLTAPFDDLIWGADPFSL